MRKAIAAMLQPQQSQRWKQEIRETENEEKEKFKFW